MGRYYEGDISGKFMFAVQGSDAADRFGSTGETPNYLEYYFDESHLPTINDELEKLKPSYELVSEFFVTRNSYNDEELKKANITKDDLSEYADYILGNKIKKCVEDWDQCQFTAEF